MVQVVIRQGNGFLTQPLIVNLLKLKGKEKESFFKTAAF